MGDVAALQSGREAAGRADWRSAYDQLAAADTEAPLGAADLELLATAAYLSARPDRAVDVFQRAFALFRRDDPIRAGLLAVQVAFIHGGRGAAAVANGWVQQAATLLPEVPDSEGRVWLDWFGTAMRCETGDVAGAAAAIDAVIERARSLGVTDVEALATLLKGQLALGTGDVAGGSALIDGVMALAVGGNLGPIATAVVYCGTVSSCATTGDLERAWSWSEEISRCSATGTSEFPGDCRFHRAEMLRLRGEWSKAEVEVASVCDQLGSWHDGHVAAAYYELGELSLLRGDLASAAHAFMKSRELGHSGQPGNAVLALAEGRADAAAAALREALATTHDRYTRASLLPSAVEALISVDDLDGAVDAVDELRRVASELNAPIFQARSRQAAGLLLLAQGQPTEARAELADALVAWRRVGAPYEFARCQVLMASADNRDRDAHLRDALEVFRRLGARVDLDRTERALGQAGRTARVTRTFMFTDIEGSTAMIADVGDDAWLSVLQRHHATIRGLLARFGGEEVNDTGDGLFVAFGSTDRAVDCALAIQREVQGVRVRIGVHRAEATRDARQYCGRGVHEAARIAAIGAGGDIVVSAATLDHVADRYERGEERRVELKGLPGPMQIVFLRT